MPFERAKTYSIRVASPGVKDGIPHRVQIADAVFAWDVFGVAAAVAGCVGRVDSGS